MKRIMAAFAAVLLSIGIAHAAKPVWDLCTLDFTFGAGGTVALTQLSPGVFSTEGMILDRKNRTIVPVASPADVNGNTTISLVRTTDEGKPDEDFGVNGRVAVTSVSAGAVSVSTTLAEDPSGRILLLVVLGPVLGYNPIRPVPGAESTLTVYRLLENGQPDATFGTAGSAVIGGLNSVFSIVSMTSDASSRVLIALGATDPTGTRIETTVLRLTTSGVLDSSFGTGGMAQNALGTTGPDRATDVLVDADGRIIVLGRTHTGDFGTSSQNRNWDFYAMRFLADGALDTSYGTNGSTVINFGLNQANGRKGRLQPDGKLVIAGTVNSTGLTSPFPSYAGWVRLDIDGSRDTTFGTNGQASISIGSYGGLLFDVAVQADGKIVGAVQEALDEASATIAAGVMRIKADGTLDTTYAGDGVTEILPARYVGSSAGSLRVDSMNRTVLSLYVWDATGDLTMLARFEPSKRGTCK